jgi:hypothetical protein
MTQQATNRQAGTPVVGGCLLLTMLDAAYGLRKWHIACQSKGINEEYR